jgi:hypothetical protein
VFLGWRDDKKPKDVVLERSVKIPAAADASVFLFSRFPFAAMCAPPSVAWRPAAGHHDLTANGLVTCVYLAVNETFGRIPDRFILPPRTAPWHGLQRRQATAFHAIPSRIQFFL